LTAKATGLHNRIFPGRFDDVPLVARALAIQALNSDWSCNLAKFTANRRASSLALRLSAKQAEGNVDINLL
jgi:hypothetical protein